MGKYREEHPELFDAEDFEYWKVEWAGMPEYKQELMTPYHSITFHFRTEADVLKFAKALKMKLDKGRSFWYPPEAEPTTKRILRYVDVPETP